MNAKKQSQIDAIASDIHLKNVCPDLAEYATQLVMGDGNLDADIVFIGEAPGKKEDLAGLPFIGASGKFLNSMLEGAGMQRADVYITNIVKYRPPDNRDPTAAEKEAFWPYLLKQLTIIQPKVVITLGRHSMNYFLPTVKIGQVHGQPQMVSFDELDLVVIPLYHPAAALYNGNLRRTLVDDFTAAAEITRTLR